MKSILLTSTALVAFAGAAAADGHISFTWSGSATAGVAREGGSDAVSGAETIAGVLLTNQDYVDSAIGTGADFDEVVEALGELGDGDALDDLAEDLGTAEVAATPGDEGTAGVSNFENDADLAAFTATAAAAAGSAEVETGDFEEYAEINATLTGSVTLDNGVMLSASASVDAGRGYDFADDDGFDTTGAQSGSVGFDNVVVDAGAFGKLTINPDDLAHLVDDDDDSNADAMYENDFGVAKLSFVLDVDKDTDVTPTAQAWSVEELADLDSDAVVLDLDGTFGLVYVAPVAADVQWSAKVEAPVADIATVYAAFDEEGGYAVGASATVVGATVTVKAKSEALAVEQGADTEFDLDVEYAVAGTGLTVGGGWNSVEDDDQWDVRASYSMSGLTVSASTDEGEDWEVTASYTLSDNASLEAGVNYTEDAYIGVAFNF